MSWIEAINKIVEDETAGWVSPEGEHLGTIFDHDWKPSDDPDHGGEDVPSCPVEDAVLVDIFTASVVRAVHSALRGENQKKLENMPMAVGIKRSLSAYNAAIKGAA